MPPGCFPRVSVARWIRVCHGQAFVRTLELCPMDIRGQLVQNVVLCGGSKPNPRILWVGPPVLTPKNGGVQKNRGTNLPNHPGPLDGVFSHKNPPAIGGVHPFMIFIDIYYGNPHGGYLQNVGCPKTIGFRINNKWVWMRLRLPMAQESPIISGSISCHWNHLMSPLQLYTAWFLGHMLLFFLVRSTCFTISGA